MIDLGGQAAAGPGGLVFICIRIVIAMLMFMFISMFIDIINPHLGLINAPLFFFQKTIFVTIHSLLSKRPEIDLMLAKSCSLFIYYQKSPVGGPGLY